MRKDAERNRSTLIAAAGQIMREEGGDVPMELIAERAGPTPGMLYRDFAHRQEMYEAVLAHDLERFTDSLADAADADPLAFIRRMTEMMMYDKFLIALSDMEDTGSRPTRRGWSPRSRPRSPPRRRAGCCARRSPATIS